MQRAEKGQRFYYKTPASFILLTISSTEPTLAPPTRTGGISTRTVSRCGVRSTPRSSGFIFLIGFFLAWRESVSAEGGPGRDVPS